MTFLLNGVDAPVAEDPGALTRAGGLVAQLRATYEEVAVEVAPLDGLDLPATERPLVPVLGQPRP